MIEILGKKIPNELTELTIQQFEDISTIYGNNSIEEIDKHLKVFELFGLSEDDFNDTSIEEFTEYVKQFNNVQKYKKMVKSFKIDGYKYSAYDKEFKLSVRDTKHLEGILRNKHKGYLSEMLAVLFKREDLSKTEHYTDAHIKHKAKLIRELKASIVVPYIANISDKMMKQIPDNEPAQVME
jgi:hypothetical protein